MTQNKTVFYGRKSYTSHRDLKPGVLEAIENSDQALPLAIVLPDGTELDWEVLMENEELRPSSAGYFQIHPWVKVRCEIIAQDPDYDSPNGCGARHTKLTVISTVPVWFKFTSEEFS